jgi:hypothetical protein
MMSAPVDRPLEFRLTFNPFHVFWSNGIISLRLAIVFIRGDDGGDSPGHILGE